MTCLVLIPTPHRFQKTSQSLHLSEAAGYALRQSVAGPLLAALSLPTPGKGGRKVRTLKTEGGREGGSGEASLPSALRLGGGPMGESKDSSSEQVLPSTCPSNPDRGPKPAYLLELPFEVTKTGRILKRKLFNLAL